ncbi:hypothetical protein AB0L40_05475 [Patulibacter sp. NPDC049589]|uniref:hypothetical protein n=1 Tax=Patulibacter sp. NPDC049589 TaxID=3154731 RepID=UPI0034246667
MIDRDLDIPELHRALAVAAARRAPAPRSARWSLRPRLVAALCVAVLALVGVVAVDASPTTTGAPVAREDRALRPVSPPALLRCVLALVPATVVADPEGRPGVTRC